MQHWGDGDGCKFHFLTKMNAALDWYSKLATFPIAIALIFQRKDLYSNRYFSIGLPHFCIWMWLISRMNTHLHCKPHFPQRHRRDVADDSTRLCGSCRSPSCMCTRLKIWLLEYFMVNNEHTNEHIACETSIFYKFKIIFREDERNIEKSD